MNRILSIVVALLAFCTVLTVGAAYAVPAAPAVTALMAVEDSSCDLAPAPVLSLSGKFCVKRHTLGLPCSPVPGILPVAAAFAVAPLPLDLLESPALLGAPARAWNRHFRPPRAIRA